MLGVWLDTPFLVLGGLVATRSIGVGAAMGGWIAALGAAVFLYLPLWWEFDPIFIVLVFLFIPFKILAAAAVGAALGFLADKIDGLS